MSKLKRTQKHTTASKWKHFSYILQLDSMKDSAVHSNAFDANQRGMEEFKKHEESEQ